MLGALVPGPAEFIGTAAAVLLASRYYVTKESTPADDLAAFGASLPGEFPPATDSILSPVQGVGKRIAEIDLDILQDDIQQAPTRLQRWVGGLDDAAGTIAPPAAALGATVLAGQIANLPLLSLVLPRALELVGVAYLVAAVNKYGTDPDAEVKDDLAAAARGGDAVKKLAASGGRDDRRRGMIFSEIARVRGGDVEVSARTTRREEEEAAAGSRSIAV